jgi:hypothetical protein
MPTDYYLQNLTFDRDRDIECGGDMVVGSSILPPNRYLYDFQTYSSLSTSETKKSQSDGVVLVTSGKQLNLEAKTSIKFNSGFKVTNGSYLTAKVNGTDPNVRSSDYESMPCGIITKFDSETKTPTYIVGNDNRSVDWTMTGYNTYINRTGNAFEIPRELRKGQYSLHAVKEGCELSTIVFLVQESNNSKKEGKNEFTFTRNESFQIMPNPATSTLNVVSGELFCGLLILDSFGQQVLSVELSCSTNSMDLNIGNYASGIYLVVLSYSNGNKESKKLVIQH